MKQIKTDTHKWKDTLCSQVGVIDNVKILLEFTVILFGNFTLLLFIHFLNIICLFKSVMTPIALNFCPVTQHLSSRATPLLLHSQLKLL